MLTTHYHRKNWIYFYRFMILKKPCIVMKIKQYHCTTRSSFELFTRYCDPELLLISPRLVSRVGVTWPRPGRGQAPHSPHSSVALITLDSGSDSLHLLCQLCHEIRTRPFNPIRALGFFLWPIRVRSGRGDILQVWRMCRSVKLLWSLSKGRDMARPGLPGELGSWGAPHLCHLPFLHHHLPAWLTIDTIHRHPLSLKCL